MLQLADLPRPIPVDGEVLIRTRAVSVSSSDCSFRAADPFFARFATGLVRPRKPVLGVEVAGEVAAVGDTRRFGSRRVVLAFAGLRSARAKAADMAVLTALAEAGELRPVIDQRWPLAQAAEAHRYVDRGRKRGAVVLTV